MEINSNKWPRFIVQRSALIGESEHQMSVAMDLQGWFDGPFDFDEPALLDLFRAAKTFMQAHTAGQTVDAETFTIQESWSEQLSGLETVLEEVPE